MVLLDNESFLREMTLLYQSTRNTGSVYLTMKKYDGRTKPRPKPYSKKRKAKNQKKSSVPEPVHEDLCMIRANNGKKKISTVVNAKDVNKFQMAYISALRVNLDGLKKREKKKTKTTDNSAMN